MVLFYTVSRVCPHSGVDFITANTEQAAHDFGQVLGKHLAMNVFIEIIFTLFLGFQKNTNVFFFLFHQMYITYNKRKL